MRVIHLRKFILILLLVMVGVAFLAAMPVRVAQAQNVDEDSPPDDCAACHEDQYAMWAKSNHASAVTDPRFIEARTRAGNPTYCLTCHATDYNPVTTKASFEGVACGACHKATGNTLASNSGPHMTIDKSSELCGTCHTGTHAPDYDQWLVSGHATMNIGCVDCHQSHNAALRIEDPTALCESCHKIDNISDMHGASGMACHDCHMAKGGSVVDTLSGQTNGAGHTMTIPAEVCGDCHGMTHTLDIKEKKSVANENEQIAAELSSCQQQSQADAASKLNIGLVGGGLGGLAIGLVGILVLRRRS